MVHFTKGELTIAGCMENPLLQNFKWSSKVKCFRLHTCSADTKLCHLTVNVRTLFNYCDFMEIVAKMSATCNFTKLLIHMSIECQDL